MTSVIGYSDSLVGSWTAMHQVKIWETRGQRPQRWWVRKDMMMEMDQQTIWHDRGTLFRTAEKHSES